MGEIKQTLQVPTQHLVFAGHFPGNPIVPGALLLLWLQQCIEQALPTWQVVGVPAVKFLSPVKPGDTLEIEGTLTGPAGRLVLTATGSAGIVCKASFSLLSSGHD